MWEDLQRWALRFGLDFSPNPHLPVDTPFLMRGAIGLLGTPIFARFLDAVFSGLWAKGLDLSKPEVLDGILRGVGLSFDEASAAASRADVKHELRKLTEAAIERGVFGCPTFFVGERMYFGQDRLDFVFDALREERP